MPYRGLFFLQALVLAVIGAIHVTALEYSLYWHYIWLDVPVHFLGGFWTALASVWVLAALSLPVRTLPVLAAVIAVGIGWEVFEVIAGVPVEGNFAFDTSLDMLMDVLGGLAALLIAHRFIRA